MTTRRILVVDDEPSLRQMLQILFQRNGFEVALAPGMQLALEAIASVPQPFPLLLTDLVMPDGSGIELLKAAKARSAATEVIVMTAHSSVEVAVEAMRLGAYDFLQKPFLAPELVALASKALEKGELVAENQRLRARVAPPPRGIAGQSPAILKVAELADKIAASRTTVLITGESGTGKELFARYIHERSERRGPFLVVNCGALPEQLMESELFGHEKGAFTGASGRHDGIFRAARGGTVFLDEIGELPLLLQPKLLRVLQERKVRPVGSSQEEPADVRIIAATNRRLEEEVAARRFREDLFYRLNVIRIALPPLRERREDIENLSLSFIKRFASEMAKDVRGLTPDALALLLRYPFPGNVRELENTIERAVALADSPTIGPSDLPAELGLFSSKGSSEIQLPDSGCDLDAVLNEVERRLLLQALERSGGNRKQTAQLLGIKLRSLRYRLAKFGLDSAEDATFPEEEPPTSQALLTEQKLSALRRGS
jgi:two-component system response regulator PilR (NtrC family)